MPRPHPRRLPGVARRWAVAGVIALAACGGDPPAAQPSAGAARPAARPAPRAAFVPARDPRLREDCGDWVPASDLLDLAARLGDTASKPDALAALDAAPVAHRIDVLRAGLRLADVAAARACAARLEWKWIDGWECARCVDLLVEDVLRPESEADFDELRSYMGSVDLPRIFANAPPLPWSVAPAQVAGQMHRLQRPAHAALFLLPDPRLPELLRDTLASEYFATACHLSDANRGVLHQYWYGDAPADTPPGPCLPPLIRQWWTVAMEWTNELGEKPWEPHPWDIRWMLASPVSDADAAMLCDALDRLHHRALSRGVAVQLLGKARDERSAAKLRALISEDDWGFSARLALARRGDDGMLAWAESEVTTEADFDCLATLMETAPARARRLFDTVLLGDDDAAAHRLLGALERFARPGAIDLAIGHPDWRRTAFDGFEAAAAGASLPALRLGRIALSVPGCRTRRVAAVVASRLTAADLDAEAHDDDDARSDLDLNELGAFLETGARDVLVRSLRTIAAETGPARDTALCWLASIGDPASAELLVAEIDRISASIVALARTKAPVVRANLEGRVKSAQESRDADALRDAVQALAVFHGLPEDASSAFGSDLTEADVAQVLDGRPTDALVAVVARLLPAPDAMDGAAGPEWAGDVGAVDDPRIREWLREVRRRRDLESYWYATGQLAASGDASARAEMWGVIRDGRYRIVDDASESFALTLGWDLAATLPHWIAELETNCCRANVAKGVLRDTLGFSDGATARTDVERARATWDAAGGRFVRSRIAERWVPEPR